MDNENNESPDSQNGENADELDGLDASALKEVLLKERTQRTETEAKNRQLFERLKKEQGFERDPDDPTNWIKTTREVKKEPVTKSKSMPEKSGEVDYGLLAFYNSKSEVKIEHDDDVQFLKDEVEKSGKPMMELLTNKYFLGDLKERQDVRIVKDATPSSTGRTGTSKKDVSYWLTQPYEKVPEHMKYAVLDAIKEEQQKTAQR